MYKLQINKIEEGSRKILEGLGVNLNSEHFNNTPARMAASIAFHFRGINEKDLILQELNVSFKEKSKNMIVLKNLKGLSLCPHHLLPISYTANFAYIPNGKSVGASKPYKIFKILAAQPITQEELTEQFLQEFWKKIKPSGCIVQVEGKFFCFEKDGVDSESTSMITVAAKGVFLSNKNLEVQFSKLIK